MFLTNSSSARPLDWQPALVIRHGGDDLHLGLFVHDLTVLNNLQKRTKVFTVPKQSSRTLRRRPTRRPAAPRQRATSARAITLHNPTPRSQGWVFPPRYITTIRTFYQGKVIASASSGSYFSVYGNSLYQPFSTASSISTSGLIQATGGSGATQAYVGTNALDSVYGAYKILRNKLTFRCLPTSSGDQTTITAYPVQAESGSISLTPYNASIQPNAKSIICTGYAPVRQQQIVIDMYSHVALGLTKQQYDDLPVTLTGSIPAVNQTWEFACQWSEVDNSSNASTICFTVELEATVEMSLPNTLTN